MRTREAIEADIIRAQREVADAEAAVAAAEDDLEDVRDWLEKLEFELAGCPPEEASGPEDERRAAARDPRQIGLFGE